MDVEVIQFNEYVNNIEYYKQLKWLKYEFIHKTKYNKEYLGTKKACYDINKNKLYLFDLLPKKLFKQDLNLIQKQITSNKSCDIQLSKTYFLLLEVRGG